MTKLRSSLKQYDPFQDWVTALFKFNNNVTNTAAQGVLPKTEGATWNAFGSQAWLSKPNGGSYTYSTTAKFGTHSFNFGNSRRIHYSNYDAFQMHRDFTWEAWVYVTDLSTDNYIWGRGDASSASVGSYLRLNSGGNGLVFWYQNNTILSTSTSGLISTNTWYHLAVTRKGDDWRVFVNGVQEGSTTTNSVNSIPGAQSVLGGDNVTSATNYFKGLCDSFRFTKSICRYTSNFTPPQFDFPDYVPYADPGGNDPFYSQIAGLWHFNGTNGATSFTDSGPNGLTATRSGTTANMGVLSTSNMRFGSACFVMNSGYVATGCGLLMPSSSHLNFGTGDFTIETWVCRNGNVKLAYLFSNTASSLEIRMQDNKGRIEVTYNGSVIITSAMAIADGYWHHLAVGRAGTTLYLFIDGLLQGTATLSNSLDISGSLFGRRTSSDVTGSGGTGGTTYCGNLDELRITKAARYTGDFIIPRGPFPDS